MRRDFTVKQMPTPNRSRDQISSLIELQIPSRL
jgi:hypothetical protein